MSGPVTIAQPAGHDPVGAEIERRVMCCELARRGVGATLRFVDPGTAADVDEAALFGERHPPLAVLFWRTLDARAVDVRTRMLDHLGVLGQPADAGDGFRVDPTDRWILVNAGAPDGLPDELAALRVDDPRRSRATEMLDAAFDSVAEALGRAGPHDDGPTSPPDVASVRRDARSAASIEMTSSPAPSVTVPWADAPEIIFVVVTYGTGPIVLEAIEALTETADRPFEVVVVDNPHPSRPGRSRRHLLLATQGVRVVTPDRNLGFGGGCELGVMHARGPLLGLVNPDLEVGAGWLAPLVDTLADPAVAVAAPVLLDPDGCVQEAGQRLTRDLWTTAETRPERAGASDFASAACWVVTRRWHERVGGFDAAFHPAYFEDADYVLRARELGGRLDVVAAVQVVHHRGGSTDAVAEPIAQHTVFAARWASTLSR